jgi:hypothetical protein
MIKESDIVHYAGSCNESWQQSDFSSDQNIGVSVKKVISRSA